MAVQAPCALCGSLTAERGFWDPDSEKQVLTCASVYGCFGRQRMAAELAKPPEPLKAGQYVWRQADGRHGRVQRVTSTQAEVLWPQDDVTLEDRRAVKRITTNVLSAEDFAKLTGNWPSYLPR
jgi:hypothetical protein